MLLIANSAKEQCTMHHYEAPDFGLLFAYFTKQAVTKGDDYHVYQQSTSKLPVIYQYASSSKLTFRWGMTRCVHHVRPLVHIRMNLIFYNHSLLIGY